jgi:hypothetical protein
LAKAIPERVFEPDMERLFSMVVDPKIGGGQVGTPLPRLRSRTGAKRISYNPVVRNLDERKKLPFFLRFLHCELVGSARKQRFPDSERFCLIFEECDEFRSVSHKAFPSL